MDAALKLFPCGTFPVLERAQTTAIATRTEAFALLKEFLRLSSMVNDLPDHNDDVMNSLQWIMVTLTKLEKSLEQLISRQ